MKTILFTIFLSATLVPSSAQTSPDSSKHLTFKGVPIDGSLAEYVSRLKENGFIQKSTKDGTAVLEGDFASYKNCTVRVSTLKQKDLVSTISVMFPNQDIWSSLSTNYFNLKELLTEKYGKPSESKEKFQSYTPEDDGSKILQVKMGACKYYTTYETERGTIHLSIEHTNLTSCFVKLTYLDKINGETIKKEALKDL